MPLTRRFGVLAGILGAVLVLLVLAVAIFVQPDNSGDTVLDNNMQVVPAPQPPPPPPPAKEPPLNQ
jgi:hypothetical protein